MGIVGETEMVLSQLILKYFQNAFQSEIWTPAVIQRVVTLAILMLLSLLGNTIVIAVLTCSRTRCAASRVNVFIIHLAIGDLAVCLITMTGEILFEVFGEWVLGGIACKVVTYSEIVSLSSTTFLLMVMSWDRYVAICRPLDFTISARRARSLIFGAWSLAFVMAIPHLFIFVQVLEGYHPDGAPVYACLSRGYSQEWQRKLMFTWLTFYILLLPSMVITYCYVSIVRVVFSQSKDQQLELSGEWVSITEMGVIFERTKKPYRDLRQNRWLCCAAEINAELKVSLSGQNQDSENDILHHSDFRGLLDTLLRGAQYQDMTSIPLHTLNLPSYKISQPVIVFAETMALLNSVLNPILYGCFNLRLKQGLKDVCCRGSSAERNVCINSAFNLSASRSASTATVRYYSCRNFVRVSLPHQRSGQRVLSSHYAQPVLSCQLCSPYPSPRPSPRPSPVGSPRPSFSDGVTHSALIRAKSHHLGTLTYHDLHCVTNSTDCV
ncbi:annetocin receptor-like [Penaeus chinensis]|uniref:annetocin receptor-like n=1 Tax=Penaeus chinensis TaxID=139456 RepID=UPI001FB65796|nr:annetocin receptor-like [Penaeus chinensis]